MKTTYNFHGGYFDYDSENGGGLSQIANHPNTLVLQYEGGLVQLPLPMPAGFTFEGTLQVDTEVTQPEEIDFDMISELAAADTCNCEGFGICFHSGEPTVRTPHGIFQGFKPTGLEIGGVPIEIPEGHVVTGHLRMQEPEKIELDDDDTNLDLGLCAPGPLECRLPDGDGFPNFIDRCELADTDTDTANTLPEGDEPGPYRSDDRISTGDDGYFPLPSGMEVRFEEDGFVAHPGEATHRLCDCCEDPCSIPLQPDQTMDPSRLFGFGGFPEGVTIACVIVELPLGDVFDSDELNVIQGTFADIG